MAMGKENGREGAIVLKNSTVPYRPPVSEADLNLKLQSSDFSQIC